MPVINNRSNLERIRTLCVPFLPYLAWETGLARASGLEREQKVGQVLVPTENQEEETRKDVVFVSCWLGYRTLSTTPTINMLLSLKWERPNLGCGRVDVAAGGTETRKA